MKVSFISSLINSCKFLLSNLFCICKVGKKMALNSILLPIIAPEGFKIPRQKLNTHAHYA